VYVGRGDADESVVFIRGSRSTSMGVERGNERIGVQPLVGGCMDATSTATDTSGSECISGNLNVTTRCRRGTGPKKVSCDVHCLWYDEVKYLQPVEVQYLLCAEVVCVCHAEVKYLRHAQVKLLWRAEAPYLCAEAMYV
jgi:hypothetical protein